MTTLENPRGHHTSFVSRLMLASSLILTAGCIGSVEKPYLRDSGGEGVAGVLEESPLKRDAYRGRRVGVVAIPKGTAASELAAKRLASTAQAYAEEALGESPNYRVLRSAEGTEGGTELIVGLAVGEIEKDVFYDEAGQRWTVGIAASQHSQSRREGVIEVNCTVTSALTGEILATRTRYGVLLETRAQDDGRVLNTGGSKVRTTRIPTSQATREAVFAVMKEIDELLVQRKVW